MSKATDVGMHYKPDILHLLEYCPVTRAAEVLDCKVDDLISLREMGKITFCYDFFGQPATTSYQLVSTTDAETSTGTTKNELLFMATELPAGPHGGAILVDEEYWSNIYSLEDVRKETQLLLFGLWCIDDRFSLGYDKYEGDFRIMSAGESSSGIRFIVLMPEGWQTPPISEAFIMRDDLLRVRHAMLTGEPLDVIERLPVAKNLLEQNHKHLQDTQPRIGPKVYKALAQALSVLGFTEKDFKSSIPQLKAKLAAKKLSGALTDIDDKTLIDWLTKAGVR